MIMSRGLSAQQMWILVAAYGNMCTEVLSPVAKAAEELTLDLHDTEAIIASHKPTGVAHLYVVEVVRYWLKLPSVASDRTGSSSRRFHGCGDPLGNVDRKAYSSAQAAVARAVRSLSARGLIVRHQRGLKAAGMSLTEKGVALVEALLATGVGVYEFQHGPAAA
jgi:hypothetical protein